MHPKIQQVMGPYMKQQDGKVGLARLLRLGNLKLADLPTIPGVRNICYNYVMGKCWGSGCFYKAGHLGKMKIPNKFADDLCQLISPAIKTHFNDKTGEGGGTQGVKQEKKGRRF